MTAEELAYLLSRGWAEEDDGPDTQPTGQWWDPSHEVGRNHCCDEATALRLQRARDVTFQQATYFTCDDDCEQLSCDTVEDAIEEHLDGWQCCGADTVALIRERGPVEVFGHSQKIIDEFDMNSWTLRLGEQLGEWVDDEFGDPEGDHNLDTEEFERELLPLVRKCIAKHTVWQCESAGSRIYTVDEVMAMMKQHRPEWFEEETKP